MAEIEHTGNPSARQRLLELADRCEGGTPGRELDAVIYARLGFCLHINTTYEAVQSDSGRTCDDCGADSWGNRNAKGQRLNDPVPRYSSSLDAAVTLVPEGAWWRVGVQDGSAYASVVGLRIEEQESLHAKTAPMAICAASLRALAQEAGV